MPVLTYKTAKELWMQEFGPDERQFRRVLMEALVALSNKGIVTGGTRTRSVELRYGETFILQNNEDTIQQATTIQGSPIDILSSHTISRHRGRNHGGLYMIHMGENEFGNTEYVFCPGGSFSDFAIPDNELLYNNGGHHESHTVILTLSLRPPSGSVLLDADWPDSLTLWPNNQHAIKLMMHSIVSADSRAIQNAIDYSNAAYRALEEGMRKKRVGTIIMPNMSISGPIQRPIPN